MGTNASPGRSRPKTFDAKYAARNRTAPTFSFVTIAKRRFTHTATSLACALFRKEIGSARTAKQSERLNHPRGKRVDERPTTKTTPTSPRTKTSLNVVESGERSTIENKNYFHVATHVNRTISFTFQTA